MKVLIRLQDYGVKVINTFPASEGWEAVFCDVSLAEWYEIPLLGFALVEHPDGTQNMTGVVFWDGMFTLADYEVQFMGYNEPGDKAFYDGTPTEYAKEWDEALKDLQDDKEGFVKELEEAAHERAKRR